jgi:hypothetical protein
VQCHPGHAGSMATVADECLILCPDVHRGSPLASPTHWPSGCADGHHRPRRDRSTRQHQPAGPDCGTALGSEGGSGPDAWRAPDLDLAVVGPHARSKRTRHPRSCARGLRDPAPSPAPARARLSAGTGLTWLTPYPRRGVSAGRCTRRNGDGAGRRHPSVGPARDGGEGVRRTGQAGQVEVNATCRWRRPMWRLLRVHSAGSRSW